MIILREQDKVLSVYSNHSQNTSYKLNKLMNSVFCSKFHITHNKLTAYI